MTLEIIILFVIIITVIFLFALEIFPVDKIAFFIMVSLLFTNLISPEEAISGFSSPATITVLALMIIAIGLEDEEKNSLCFWRRKCLANQNESRPTGRGEKPQLFPFHRNIG